MTVAFVVTVGLLLFDIMEYLDGNFGEPLGYEQICEIQGVSFIYVLMMMALLNWRNTRMCALLYSIGWSGYSLLTTLSIDPTQSDYFFYLILADAASIGGALCTVGYAMGYNHNVTRIIVFAAVDTVSSFLPWIINHIALGSISILDPELIYFFPSIISGLLYISIMARKDVKDISPKSEMVLRLSRVEAALTVSNEAYMPLEDVGTMLGLREEGWQYFPEGRIEKTCSVELIGATKRRWRITVKKWRDEDFLRAVMSPNLASDGNYGFSFDIVSYHFKEHNGKGFVRIYGHDGMFVEFYTENPSVDKENMVSRGFDMMVKEF